MIKKLADMIRSGLLIICSCDQLKHCNSQGSADARCEIFVCGVVLCGMVWCDELVCGGMGEVCVCVFSITVFYAWPVIDIYSVCQ